HVAMSANQVKSRTCRKELPDIELKARLTEMGLWLKRLSLLKYDRDADIPQKAVVEDLFDYFIKLEAVLLQERRRRECLADLKSARQELAAIEAEIGGAAGEEKQALEERRTLRQNFASSVQEMADKADRTSSELAQEIGGDGEYVAFINRALDRLGMKPDSDLRPELLSAEDSAPVPSEPPNTDRSTDADTHTARKTVAEAVKKKLNNPSEYRGMLIEEVQYAISLGRSSVYRLIECGALEKRKRRPGAAKNSRTLIMISSVLAYMEQNDIDINAL
ncbi:MAG: hypothetical protein WA830_07305, partial [Candidatus Sulfotelmatobacter sp.]